MSRENTSPSLTATFFGSQPSFLGKSRILFRTPAYFSYNPYFSYNLMGVAPPAGMGRVPSGPPNVFGGNMDNRDLGAGATVYFPVHVPGALLSIGDGHAAQGEGEVCLSAVETSLKGAIQVILHKNTPIKWPRAETATHYITIGLHPDLNEAAKIATREMLDFIVQAKRLKRDDAYMLLSATMDLVVTQVVDGTKGIHAMLPKSIFTK